MFPDKNARKKYAENRRSIRRLVLSQLMLKFWAHFSKKRWASREWAASAEGLTMPAAGTRALIV